MGQESAQMIDGSDASDIAGCIVWQAIVSALVQLIASKKTCQFVSLTIVDSMIAKPKMERLKRVAGGA